MKKLLLTALLCFCVNAYAFNWKKVGESLIGDNYYVDVSNIKKHNGLIYYWELVDYLDPNLGANSSIGKYKANCGEEKLTWLNVTYYSQSMGRGKIITESTPENIQYPKPNSVGYVVMKFACKNAR